jgi:AAA15 family ATPase/GTPase
MEAASIKEHKESVINRNKYKLLPVAVFYGANSSGKSNLIISMLRMRSIVITSNSINPGQSLQYDPFALDETSKTQPTFFEIQFIYKETLYRYGFEYNKVEIVSEWLYEKKFGEKEYELFIRSGEEIEVDEKRFLEGKLIKENNLTSKNRLFLSVVAQFNGEKSKLIFEWFLFLNGLSGLDDEKYGNFTSEVFLNEQYSDIANKAQEFFNDLQLGFSEFSVELGNKGDEDKAVMLDELTTHNIYNQENEKIGTEKFSKDKMESEGTKKVISLSGPIFATLKSGGILIVDELDAKLHPLLTRNIVLLFMDPEKNTNGAQLIFATHDTNLLDLAIIRRDQIWFAEKDNVESTDIYSLVEFKDEEGKKVRNDCDIDIKCNYIKGRYGAIPFIK